MNEYEPDSTLAVVDTVPTEWIAPLRELAGFLTTIGTPLRPGSAGWQVDRMDVASPTLSGSVPFVMPLQAGSSSALLATLGILVLALLGGGLALRNRLPIRRPSQSAGVSAAPPFETDRDQVCSLVRDNGGRMRQSEIVESVDWSKAKVSRLLADLEAEGRVTKLRLGRENLICLPGSEPTASRPPEPSNTE